MNLRRLQTLINEALKHENNDSFYEQWYSPYYQLMYLCANDMKGLCVELGVHNGRGAYSMLKSGRDVIGIDTYEHENLSKLKSIKRFTFVNESSIPAP